jgi:integrase
MWIVDYDDHGRRRRVSTGIKTAPQRNPPQDAKEAAREIILGIRTPKFSAASAAGQARKGDGRLTMSELFDKCEGTIWHPDNVRSQRTIRSNVRILSELIGNEAVEDMTFTRLETLVGEMKARGYQPATIKRKLAMVARALKMATMWTGDDGKPLLRYKPPLPRIVVNNLKERIISAAEEEALFVALEKRRQLEPHRQWFAFRVFLWLLFDTGGRLGETLGLGPKNVAAQKARVGADEREVSFITFPRYRTKSGKPRTLPLSPRSVDALGTLMDHLTLDKSSGEWRFFGFTASTADVMFRQIREDVLQETGLDVSDVTLHTIRHTVATRLAQGGMDLARLQQWLGHSDPKITAERYLHLIPSDLVAGLAILSGTGGIPDAAKARDRIKHGTVPNTKGEAIGASPGTMSLQ